MAEHPDCTLVRRGYDAFTKGDFDTLATIMTADIAHHVPGEHPLAGHHKGLEAVFQFYRRVAEETNGTFRLELKRLYADGRGHVISTYTSYADRKDVGVEMPCASFFTIVGGKISDIDDCVEDIEAHNDFWRR